jgi:phosphomannomutase
MAIALANKEQADIVIGTDPDCDRLGIAVRDANGKMKIINGNQAMAIKTYFLLDQLKEQNALNQKHFVASTIVSTPMVEKIAAKFGVIYKEGLTGFKWIAKMVKDFPELDLVGGGEVSFGYMVGDFVRDKDAVTAALLACEIAAIEKEKGNTLLDYFDTIQKEVGFYKEQLISVVKKGKKGAEEIATIMKQLRENPFTEINDSKVVKIEDYLTSEVKDTLNNSIKTIEIPKSNVLIYYTEDGSKIAARPSGTEPKIKIYISVTTEEKKNTTRLLDDRIAAIQRQLNFN